jgi:hypothetical protein
LRKCRTEALLDSKMGKQLLAEIVSKKEELKDNVNK